MKAIKWMLFGIACMILSLCCILAFYLDAGVFALIAIVGFIICILAMSMKE